MSATADAPDRWQVGTTVAVLALSATSSLLGLFRAGHYDVEPALLARLQAQDAVVLFVAVPVLAVGLVLARRGSLRGRIVWLGALASMTYLWSSVATTTPFNDFFLGYVALFSLSLFTLVGAVADTDPEPVRRVLDGEISRTGYAALLALIGLGLAALWLSDIVPATLAGTRPLILEELGEGAAHTYVLDLGVVVPSLAVTAAWLRRGRPWGYAFAGILLVMAALLAPTLTAITVADALGDVVTLTPPLVIGTVVPPAVAVAFAVRYLRALGRREPDVWPHDERGVDV